jgi:hypothetical protein
MNRVSYFVFTILSLNTFFQVIELWYMPRYQGDTYFNLAARVPGMFSHAHGCASFYRFVYLLFHKEKIMKAIIFILFAVISGIK